MLFHLDVARQIPVHAFWYKKRQLYNNQAEISPETKRSEGENWVTWVREFLSCSRFRRSHMLTKKKYTKFLNFWASS